MRRLTAAAFLVLAFDLSAQAQTPVTDRPEPTPPVIGTPESPRWNLVAWRAATSTATHVRSPEHLDADLAILIASDSSIDPSAHRLWRTMVETGLVESTEALKTSRLALRVAEQNLADFEA
jgi:hypothetical protein